MVLQQGIQALREPRAKGERVIRRRFSDGTDEANQADIRSAVPDQIRQQPDFTVKILGPSCAAVLIPIQNDDAVAAFFHRELVDGDALVSAGHG